ncbi:MAG: hypothetical protein HGB10_06205 [Coriobacteriia bacterium]|nr:hypothetical protein [Coriobacteriia bacterium]
MPDKPSRKIVFGALGAMAALSVVVLVLVLNLPEVIGLGSKVKLPIFHGASTWVDLMLFLLLGIVAVIFLIRRNDRLYGWVVGLRAVAMPLWALNSVMGFVAAMSAWDFTGSSQSPLVVARQDPRLTAQFVLLLGVGIVLLLDWLVLETRFQKAIADVTFVVIAAFLLSDIFLDPAKRALHPDSPVLNSGWEIKGPFFGIVAAWFAVMLIGAWLVRGFVGPQKPAVADSVGDSPEV